MGHVVRGALDRLESLAQDGGSPEQVAAEAKAIAAGWWWNASGDMSPARLAALVQELRRWCAVAASHYALQWDHLHRAGRPAEAERARQAAMALDRARAAVEAAGSPSHTRTIT